MASPSIPNPFAAGANSHYGIGDTGTTLLGPPQHGSAEQWRGSVFSSDIGGRLGMTPPMSPRRSTSPRQRSTITLPSRSMSARRRMRDDDDDRRSRERDREDQQRGRQLPDEQPLAEGWGQRMLRAEMKIRALEENLNDAKSIIESNSVDMFKRVDQMKTFVMEVEGRFSQWERSIPERMHQLEQKEDGTRAIINETVANIQNKFVELENLINARPVPSTPAGFGGNSTCPPIPPSFGGLTSAKPSFHIGSPLSAPTPVVEANPPGLDPWSNFQPPSMAAGSALPNPMDAGSKKPWDPRIWSISEAKVSKELKPFDGSHAKYRTWANRVKDHFKKKYGDWEFVFEEIEKQKVPISKELLVTTYIVTENFTFDVDLAICSNAL